MPEIIRRRVNPVTGEVLGTTTTSDLNIPDNIESFTRQQRPFVFDNVVVEDYAYAELVGYDFSGTKLWERGLMDDEAAIGGDYQPVATFGNPYPISATTSHGEHLYYIRPTVNYNDYSTRVYVFKASATTGAVDTSSHFDVPAEYGYDFHMGGIFSTTDNLVVSASGSHTSEDRFYFYVLNRDTLSVETTLSGAVEEPYTDPDDGLTVAHLYSPASNSALVRINNYTAWVDFDEGIVKSAVGNLLFNSRMPLVTTNGMVFKDTRADSVVLSYATNDEIEALPSFYRTFPSGKAGQPLTPGRYTVPDLPFSTPAVVDGDIVVVSDFTPAGETEPGTWALSTSVDTYSNMVYIDGFPYVNGSAQFDDYVSVAVVEPGNIWLPSNWGDLTIPVIETESYILLLMPLDSAFIPTHKIEKSTGAVLQTGLTNTTGGAGFSYVVDGDIVYLIGFDSNLSYKDESYRVDLQTDTIESIATPTGVIDRVDLPFRGGQGGTIHNDTLYVVVDGTIYEYNSVGDSWSTVATAPNGYNARPLNLFSLHQDGGVLTFLTPSNPDLIIETYDIDEDSWEQLSYPGTAMGDEISVLPLGGRVFLVRTGDIYAMEGAVYPY